MVAPEHVYGMSYGDWLHREAALRHVRPAALEPLLEILSFDVERCGFSARDKARASFAAVATSAIAVTDYREGERDRVTFFGARISSIYGITGTLVRYRS